MDRRKSTIHQVRVFCRIHSSRAQGVAQTDRDADEGRQHKGWGELREGSEGWTHRGEGRGAELEEWDAQESSEHGRQRTVGGEAAPEQAEDDGRTEGRGDARPPKDDEPEHGSTGDEGRHRERDAEAGERQPEGDLSGQPNQCLVGHVGVLDLLIPVAHGR